MAYNPTVYVNDNPPAINSANLNKSENELAYLDKETNNINSNLYGGNLSGNLVHGSLNFNTTPWTNNTLVRSFISTKADFRFHLMEGDTVSIDLFGSCKIYVVQDGGNNYRSGWKAEPVTIPHNGDYGVLISKNEGNFDGVDDVVLTVTAGGIQQYINIIPDVKTDATIGENLSLKNNQRISKLDGQYILESESFEIGNITIGQTIIYSDSTSRVRTRESVRLPLDVGDIITLTTGVFFPGWYSDDGTVHSGGSWKTSYTVTQKGYYIFVMRYSTESTITDMDAFLAGLSITPKMNDAERDYGIDISRALDELRFNKFYDHFLLNKINGTNVIIPLESIPSIDMSRRLGFKIIEANTKITSDGKYIVTHGTSGKFGAMFEHVDGVTDISNTMINSVTMQWIKTNVRYKSLYEKYRTAPPTLEEYLTVVKKFGMIPLLQIDNDANIVEIGNEIMGKDNYIAYNSNRTLNDGFIMNVKSYTTKADILAECQSVGYPFMYFMANPTAFSDSDLKDIIESVHDLGYTIGFQESYISMQDTNKYMQMGFDFAASTFNVNDFEIGNLYNKHADIDFSDFETNGTVENQTLKLSNGQYVRAWGNSEHFLSKAVVYIRFSGTLSMNIFSNTISGNISSDGTEYVRISCGALKIYPNVMFTASGNVTINELHAVASVV